MPLLKAPSSFQHLLESVKHYHGYRFYIPPIPQTFWSPHPHHVSSGNSLWVDLAMVGVIYRLDEVYYDILICPSMVNDGVFWVPYAFYLAVFDSFEALILIQSEYQIRGGVSWLHNVVQLASWLFLALMGASIPIDFDCGSTLPRLVTMYFPIFKLCHSTIQIVSYCDIVFVAKQMDALPRLLSSIVAVLPLIASVVLAVHGHYLVAYTMLFVSFALRYVSFYLFYMLYKPKQVKTNMPFIIQRYRDWVQIQLGSAMLGLVTSMTMDNSASALVSASYAFLAVLDLLSYSSDPKTFSKHALVRFNSVPSHLWFLLFVGLGYSILGIAVGTRYLLKQHVPSSQATWILVVSTMCSMVCLLLQKMVHENHLELRGELRTKKQVLVMMILAIATCAIAAPFSQKAGMGPWIPFNLFLSTGCVLLLHAFNGGFQREISKRVHRTKLRGQILAVLIGRAWLKRARQTIALREEQALRRSRRRTLEAISQMRLSSASPKQKRASEETLSPWSGESNDGDDGEVCMLDEADEEEIRQIKMQVSWKLQPSEVITSRRGKSTGTAAAAAAAVAPNAATARVLKTLILNRFYLKATFLVPHDVFADYHVSWSDLFFDILFVAVVYRLGYFLINGLGLGSADTNEPEVNSSQFFQAVFCFVCVYVAVFNLWFTKLNYSSKIKTSDVFHMVIDMVLGYFVLFCALDIYSPFAMAQKVSFQYWISGMLTGYHLTLLLLWVEAFTSLGKNSFLLKQSSHKCAIRNIKRQFLSLLALCIAFFTSGTGCPLVVTCFFWLCTYLFPLMQRIEDITQQPWINEAPFLLRFVLHRMADYSLLVLGEGVLQIIRAASVTQSSPEVFLPFSLAFLCMTCCRICCFQLDCLDATTASKHAVLQQQKAYNLAVSVVRLVWSGPSVVAFGVSLKLIVEMEEDVPMIYHLCGVSSTLAMLSFVTTYHLHRTAYFKNKLAWKKLVIGIALSLLFLAFPWIPELPKNWMLFTNAVVWLIGIVVLGYADDFLQAEGGGNKTASRVALPVLKTSEQTMLPAAPPKHSSRLERQKSMRNWSREVTRLQQSHSNGALGGSEEDDDQEELLQSQTNDMQVV